MVAQVGSVSRFPVKRGKNLTIMIFYTIMNFISFISIVFYLFPSFSVCVETESSEWT